MAIQVILGVDSLILKSEATQWIRRLVMLLIAREAHPFKIKSDNAPELILLKIG